MQETNYWPEGDADTLMRAQEIQNDEKRLDAATKCLEKRAIATQEALAEAKVERNMKKTFNRE